MVFNGFTPTGGNNMLFNKPPQCDGTDCHTCCECQGDSLVATCDGCGEGIFHGESYYELENFHYCEDCIFSSRKVALKGNLLN